MKVIVFGGAGFLGSHVADALTDAGYKVTVFDIKESPYIRSEQRMVVGNILDDDLVNREVSEHQVVYHLAGIADIDECAVKPVETAKYNILGTVQLLDACRGAAIERFVFASSAYVYSDFGYFYKTSKQACEAYIEDYHKLFGLNYTILRYGSLYGERSDERNSIYKIIRQALSEKKIIYHGTGDEIREYIHVRDAAMNSVAILDQKYKNQNIILTGQNAMRYSDLLEMVQEMVGDEVQIEIVPAERKAHYKITPYNFSPKLGRKMVGDTQIDMGQGLLLCMAEVYEKLHNQKSTDFGLFYDEETS